jgi:hypothetical protein
MGRNITDELAEWVASKETHRRQDAKAVAFLAIRADVIAALDAGYSMKTVWDFLREKGRITSTYEAFRRHVKKHIRPGSRAPAAVVAPTAAPVPPSPAQAVATSPGVPASSSKAPETPENQVIGKFNFNAKPDKGKLI